MISRIEGVAPHGAELKARVASGAVLAAVALLAAYVGGMPFGLLVALVAVIALWEWTAITGASDPLWLRTGALVVLAAGLIAVAASASDWALGLLGASALAALAFGFVSRSARWTGLGLVYVAVPAVGFLLIRASEPYGSVGVVLILAAVAASDTGAYFGGRRFGGPKLWPRVSPKKTWSGALSGLVAAVIAGGLVASLTEAGPFWLGMCLAAVLSIAAQAGDLLESAVKRTFGAKDSGRIIPGHGGVLDRVDGLFGAAALAWLIAALGLGGDLLTLSPASLASSGVPT